MRPFTILINGLSFSFGLIVAALLFGTPTQAQTPTPCIDLPSVTPSIIPSATLPPTMTTVPRITATPSPAFLMPPTPTQELWTDTPIPTATIIQARYRVATLQGVNVRAEPDTSADIVSALYPGQVVVVLEITPLFNDGWRWGRVVGGWVAMRSVNGVVLLVAVP